MTEPTTPSPRRTTRVARTPAGDAFTTLIGNVAQLIRLFSIQGERLARPSGQTMARWLVLEAVEQRPSSVAEIARTMALARQSVQRVADLLARDGLAIYEENPHHRRAKLLRITPAGRQVLDAIQADQRIWAAAMGAQVGEADLQSANVVLERVLQVLRSGRARGS